jgi:hypothetical protein
MPALLSGVLQYLFSVSGLLDRFIGLCITLTTPPLALLLPCVISIWRKIMFGKDLIDQGLVKDIKQLEWFVFAHY